MKISVVYGRRASDRVEMEIPDIKNEREIYHVVAEIVESRGEENSNHIAAAVLELVQQGQYTVITP